MECYQNWLGWNIIQLNLVKMLKLEWNIMHWKVVKIVKLISSACTMFLSKCNLILVRSDRKYKEYELVWDFGVCFSQTLSSILSGTNLMASLISLKEI